MTNPILTALLGLTLLSGCGRQVIEVRRDGVTLAELDSAELDRARPLVRAWDASADGPAWSFEAGPDRESEGAWRLVLTSSAGVRLESGAPYLGRGVWVTSEGFAVGVSDGRYEIEGQIPWGQ